MEPRLSRAILLDAAGEKAMRIAVVGAVLSLAASDAAAAGPMGAIKICRQRNVVELTSDRPFTIPAGTAFVNGNTKDGSQLKPAFLARTLDDAVLPPRNGCVTARAELTWNPGGMTLDTSYPADLPSQLNVPGLSIFGRVSAPFR